MVNWIQIPKICRNPDEFCFCFLRGSAVFVQSQASLQRFLRVNLVQLVLIYHTACSAAKFQSVAKRTMICHDPKLSICYLKLSIYLLLIIHRPHISSYSKPFLHHTTIPPSAHLSVSDILTRSNMNGKPCHPFLPLSGPNIGCVHRMSHSSGTSDNIVFLA
jgi:hypothetical protein